MKREDVWECENAVELAELVSEWKDDRCALNLKYSQILSNAVLSLNAEIIKLKTDHAVEWGTLLRLIEWHGAGEVLDDIEDGNKNWENCKKWELEEREKTSE